MCFSFKCLEHCQKLNLVWSSLLEVRPSVKIQHFDVVGLITNSDSCLNSVLPAVCSPYPCASNVLKLNATFPDING